MGTPAPVLSVPAPTLFPLGEPEPCRDGCGRVAEVVVADVPDALPVIEIRTRNQYGLTIYRPLAPDQIAEVPLCGDCAAISAERVIRHVHLYNAPRLRVA